MQNETKSLKNKVASGVFWKLAERLLSQATSFVISIVLARILSPDDYGLIAMVTAFTAIANVFVTSGFSTALIQKSNATSIDYASIFWCTMGMSLIVYILLFCSAPLIASFYGEPSLTLIVRIYSLVLFILAFNSIQSAYVSKKMLFRKFFFSTFAGTLGSGVVGIALALMGWGVWALVFQSLLNNLINTVVLFLIIPWHPSLDFSLDAAKHLVSYGWKILASDLLGTIYNNIRSLLAGHFYSTEQLAYFNRGQSFPDLIFSNISSALSSVMFPALTIVASDAAQVKQAFRKMLQTISFALFPVLAILIAVAEPMVELLLTDKWLGCVFFIQVISIARIIDVIPSLNLQVIRAVGRSDIALSLEFIKKPLCLIITIISCLINVEALAVSWILCSTIEAIVDVYPNRKLISYGYIEQAKDIAPYFLDAVLMLTIMSCLEVLNLSPLAALVLKPLFGLLTYIGIAALFKLPALKTTLSLLKK